MTRKRTILGIFLFLILIGIVVWFMLSRPTNEPRGDVHPPKDTALAQTKPGKSKSDTKPTSPKSSPVYSKDQQATIDKLTEENSKLKKQIEALQTQAQPDAGIVKNLKDSINLLKKQLAESKKSNISLVDDLAKARKDYKKLAARKQEVAVKEVPVYIKKETITDAGIVLRKNEYGGTDIFELKSTKKKTSRSLRPH